MNKSARCAPRLNAREAAENAEMLLIAAEQCAEILADLPKTKANERLGPNRDGVSGQATNGHQQEGFKETLIRTRRAAERLVTVPVVVSRVRVIAAIMRGIPRRLASALKRSRTGCPSLEGVRLGKRNQMPKLPKRESTESPTSRRTKLAAQLRAENRGLWKAARIPDFVVMREPDPPKPQQTVFLGEAGTEQFVVDTHVNGKLLGSQKIHDPFTRPTVLMSLIDSCFRAFGTGFDRGRPHSVLNLIAYCMPAIRPAALLLRRAVIA